MSREKYVLFWPCSGGNKRQTIKGKPDNVFSGDLATWAANISAVFANTPGSDGTAIKQINQTIETPAVADASVTKPMRGDAMVCTFTDENGDTHKYRFPRPTDADLVDGGGGNYTLEPGAGAILATQLSLLTGYTMTFVFGWLDIARVV